MEYEVDRHRQSLGAGIELPALFGLVDPFLQEEPRVRNGIRSRALVAREFRCATPFGLGRHLPE